MLIRLPPSRGLRAALAAVELGAWAAALCGTAWVLWAAAMLQFQRPPTATGVLEVLRFGRVTVVTQNRHLLATGNELHAKARTFARDGLLDQAAECYRHLLKLTPDSFDGNLEYGELLLNKGELMPAHRYLLRALQLRPDDFYANVFQARALFRLNRPDEALRHAQRAHAGGLQPAETRELVQLYQMIGSHYLGSGRYDDAVALFSRADANRKNDEIQYLLAVCYARRGLGGAGLWRRAAARFGFASPVAPEDRDLSLGHLKACLALNPLHEPARRLQAELGP